MTQYTADDVKAAITDEDTEWEGSYSEFAYMGERWDKERKTFAYDPVPLGDLGVAQVVEDYGGGEGSGEERWIVFSVTNDSGTRHFKAYGVYRSFSGTEWYGFAEVAATPTVINIWKAVK